MALQVEPQELRFKGTFLEPLDIFLTMRNTTDKRIAFKVLTTAQYHFRVNAIRGFIEPKGEKIIAVQLVEIGDATLMAKLGKFKRNKQKFMVKAALTEDNGNDLSLVDKILKETPKDEIIEQKLPVIFEEEHGGAKTAPTVQVQQSTTSEADLADTSMALMANTNASKPNAAADKTSSLSEDPQSNISSYNTVYDGSGSNPAEQVPTAADPPPPGPSSSGWIQEPRVTDANGSNQSKPPQPKAELLKTEYDPVPMVNTGRRSKQPQVSTAAQDLDNLLDSNTFLMVMLSLLVTVAVLNIIL